MMDVWKVMVNGKRKGGERRGGNAGTLPARRPVKIGNKDRSARIKKRVINLRFSRENADRPLQNRGSVVG